MAAPSGEPMDFAADSAIFLADSEHAAVVDGNGPVPVIYDAPYTPSKLFEDQLVDNVAPACSMLDADVARLGVQYGTRLTIRYKGAFVVGAFTVSAAKPDGLGLTLLTLTVAEA